MLRLKLLRVSKRGPWSYTSWGWVIYLNNLAEDVAVHLQIMFLTPGREGMVACLLLDELGVCGILG